MMRCLFPFAAAATLVAQPPILTVPVAPAPQAPPAVSAVPIVASSSTRPIDLVICLDVSGSMSGLINAARQNLWSVVNDLATLKPTPELRVALLTYGSPRYPKENGFVAVQTPFTTDLDLVSMQLFALTTNGGEEYVARVVRAALDELKWSPDPKSLKLLFVAGNEAATQDPLLDAMEQSKAAIARGIVVNTIFCGDPATPEAVGWREVAKFADGQFAAIEQDDGTVIATPFDEQLTALSAQLNTTYVPYGKDGAVWSANQVAQDGNAAGLNVVAAAQRAQTKAGACYVNPMFDLVDACKKPEFKLTEVKKEDLPEELRKLSAEELKAYVDKKTEERAALQKQVAELGAKREVFVQKERAKLGDASARLFETVVLEAVRKQAAACGFERVAPPAPPVETPENTPPAGSVPQDEVQQRPQQGTQQGTQQGIQQQTKQQVEKQAPPPANPFVRHIEAAKKDYGSFPVVTPQARVAPTDCRLPPAQADVSRAKGAHGDKLYLLYVKDAANGTYIEAGKPAPVGQTLVKEAWEKIDGTATARTAAFDRYPAGIVATVDGKPCHAGASYGLFVMHKLAADTEGADRGWIYGTVDAAGKVTAAGRIASCIACHEKATEDRRFGLR
jgi:hypothetical protein